MKKIKQILVFSGIMLGFIGCNNSVYENVENTFEEEIDVSSEIIRLGKKRQNPFSRNSRDADFSPNYVYFRIRTSSVDNIQKIEQELGDLQTTPLDYEILKGGCQTVDNQGSEDFTPWFYAMTTVDTFTDLQPLGETELLDEMYLSDEDLRKFTEDDETDGSSSRFLWFNYKKCRPKGKVQMWDEIRGCYVPVPGVKVTVSQWCHVESAYTNQEGFFDIGTNFTTCWQNTANVKVTFENGTDSVCPAWSPIKAFYNAGDRGVGDLGNITITLGNNTAQADYGRVITAANAYRKLAAKDHVTNPVGLKLWVSDDIQGGVTLMRDAMALDIGAVGAALGSIGGLGGAIVGSCVGAALAEFYLPDIIIGFKGSSAGGRTKTETAFEITFHEMSHASHFSALGGNGILYWNNEYIQMLGGWLELLTKGEDPFSNCYNNGKNTLVCLIESWGYFYGFYLTDVYFKGYELKNDYKYMLEEWENSKLSFLSYKSFYDLIDGKTTNVEYWDNIDCFTVADIFSPYKTFSIQSINDWYNKFKQLDKAKNMENDIKAIFKNNGVEL